jgi:hypothetical protein
MGKTKKGSKKNRKNRQHPYSRNGDAMDEGDGASVRLEDTRGKIVQRHKIEYKSHRTQIEQMKILRCVVIVQTVPDCLPFFLL